MKVRIHPLFPLALIAYVLFGGARCYLISLLAIFLHECSHYAVARLVGARVLSLTLLPYGASMRLSAETPRLGAILVAGPLSNLVLASLSLSACWIMPELYGTFKGFVGINAMIATVNLLPAYPLDGGRILRTLFKGKWVRLFTDLCTLLVGGASALLFLFGGGVSHLLFSAFMFSYFFFFCLGRVTRVKGEDPLFALVGTDEEGRILPAVLRIGKGRRKLSPSEIARLCVLYPREMTIGEVLRREDASELGYK